MRSRKQWKPGPKTRRDREAAHRSWNPCGLVAGVTTRDLQVWLSDDHPQNGPDSKTILDHRFEPQIGGMGLRTSALLSLLGTRNEFVSVVGRDCSAATREYLQKFQVGTNWLKDSDEPTTISVIESWRSKRRIVMGLSDALRQQTLESVFSPTEIDLLQSIPFVFLDGTGNVSLQLGLADRVGVSGGLVIAAIERDAPETKELASRASVLISSEQFLQERFGSEETSIPLEQLAAETGDDNWLTGVTLGSEGSLVLNRRLRRMIQTPTYPAIAICTAAAGDAHQAGIVHGLVNGQTPEEALATAAAAASLVVEVRGFPDSIDLREVSRRAAWIRQHQVIRSWIPPHRKVFRTSPAGRKTTRRTSSQNQPGTEPFRRRKSLL